MRNISTLVNDIYNLFTNDKGVQLSKKEARKVTNRAGKLIGNHIYNSVFEVRKDKSHLRLSQIGKPLRQLWYSCKDYTPEELESSTYIKFLYGHILEELLIALCLLAGHKVTEEQKEVKVDGVIGHQDARVDDILVDFKSTSNYSFNNFNIEKLKSKDTFGYISQLSAYALQEKDKEAAWVIVNKQTGQLGVEHIRLKDMHDVSKKIKEIKNALEKDTPPDKCFSDIPDGASGNRRLDFGCVFCDYKYTCWSDSNEGQGLRKFKYANGPKYFTKVSKEPMTEEYKL